MPCVNTIHPNELVSQYSEAERCEYLKKLLLFKLASFDNQRFIRFPISRNENIKYRFSKCFKYEENAIKPNLMSEEVFVDVFNLKWRTSIHDIIKNLIGNYHVEMSDLDWKICIPDNMDFQLNIIPKELHGFKFKRICHNNHQESEKKNLMIEFYRFTDIEGKNIQQKFAFNIHYKEIKGIKNQGVPELGKIFRKIQTDLTDITLLVNLIDNISITNHAGYACPKKYRKDYSILCTKLK